LGDFAAALPRMDSPSGIEIGIAGAERILRVTGRGTHLNSPLLRRYARQAIEQKLALLFDLGGCTYMDSTFLGMLAGLAMRCRESGRPRIRVLAANPRVREMMEDLGIDRFFDFDLRATPAAEEMRPLEGPAPSGPEKAREVLEAHRALTAAAPDNAIKFRDVIALIEEELGQAPPPSP